MLERRVRQTLPQSIRDNAVHLGHSGPDLLGVFVQLLTTGEVKLRFRDYTRRLELADKGRLLTQTQAVPLLKACLAELSGGDQPQDLADYTQNIVIQAPRSQQT
jgi:hypothetical protein